MLDRDARAKRKDQERDEETAAVNFLALAERVKLIGWPLGSFEPR